MSDGRVLPKLISEPLHVCYHGEFNGLSIFKGQGHGEIDYLRNLDMWDKWKHDKFNTYVLVDMGIPMG
jgi:hypothetical protein